MPRGAGVRGRRDRLRHARRSTARSKTCASSETGRSALGVIGGGAPEGICGSGLVDLMSELLRTGRMNEMGRFEDGVTRFTLDPAHDVYFLESDVNELAQAKGANVAGLHVVFSNYGIAFDDVDVFYLAGGFGRHLKKEASRRIGLIPNLPDDEDRPGRATPPSKARASRSCRCPGATRSRRSCSAWSTAASRRIRTSSTSSSRGASSSPLSRPNRVSR